MVILSGLTERASATYSGPGQNNNPVLYVVGTTDVQIYFALLNATSGVTGPFNLTPSRVKMVVVV